MAPGIGAGSIRHGSVLMLENRSFEHMLGFLRISDTDPKVNNKSRSKASPALSRRGQTYKGSSAATGCLAQAVTASPNSGGKDPAAARQQMPARAAPKDVAQPARELSGTNGGIHEP